MGIDPGSLALAGLVLSTIGTGAGVVGQMQSADAASKSASYQSEVAANNAEQAKKNASRAAAAGDQQANMEQLKTRAQIGAIKADQAASGVDVNSGSAVDVRSSAAELGQLNAISIRSNAARQAYGYQVQSSNDTAQAGLDKAESSNDLTAGYFGAGSTFLGGMGSAANNYANFTTKSRGMTASATPTGGVVDAANWGSYGA